MIISEKKQIKMLSNAEMELIHLGACRLLSRVGVKVTHEVIAEKLISQGALRKGERITIPANMVENALAKTAKTIQFDAPDPAYSFTLNAVENRVKFGPGGQALYIVHPAAGGWGRRPAGTDDLKQILVLCNRLKNVDFITRPVECDVPEDRMDLEKARIFRQYCSKPMNLANLIKVEHLDRVLEMIGDPAHVSFIISLISSPLVLDSAAGDKFIALVENLPVSISCCPQAEAPRPFRKWESCCSSMQNCSLDLFWAMSSDRGQVTVPGIPVTSIFIPTVLPGGVSRKVFDGLPLRHSSVVL